MGRTRNTKSKSPSKKVSNESTVLATDTVLTTDYTNTSFSSVNDPDEFQGPLSQAVVGHYTASTPKKNPPDVATTKQDDDSSSTISVNKIDNISVLQAKVTKQECTIADLNARLTALEIKFTETVSTLAITKQVSSVLEQQLDDLQQYSRRNCVVVTGIKAKRDETEN